MGTLSYEDEGGNGIILQFNEHDATDLQGAIEKLQEQFDFIVGGGSSDPEDEDTELEVPEEEEDNLPVQPIVIKAPEGFAPPHPMSFGDWLQTQPEWGKVEAPPPEPETITKEMVDTTLEVLQNNLGVPKEFLQLPPFDSTEQKLISNVEFNLKITDVETVPTPLKSLFYSYEIPSIPFPAKPQMPKSENVGTDQKLAVVAAALADKVKKKDKATKASLLSVITQQLNKVLDKNPGWKKTVQVVKGPNYEIPFTKVSAPEFKKPEPKNWPVKEKKTEPLFAFPIPSVPTVTKLHGPNRETAIKMFGPNAEHTAVLQEVGTGEWHLLPRALVLGIRIDKWVPGVDINTITWGTYAALRKQRRSVDSIESHRDRAAGYQSLLATALDAIEMLLKIKHGQILAFNSVSEMANSTWTAGKQNKETLDWICEEEKKGCIQWGPPRVTIDAVKLPDGRVVDLS